ncbi:hypothetical protein WJX73_005736 [Symbiochloris irregularis]|uniref:Acyl-coenzyme A oxidase n=1 Tax=Symbiochloris irregularis TaxID=706552 RepID=A0AAW1PAJ1_9CHLO
MSQDAQSRARSLAAQSAKVVMGSFVDPKDDMVRERARASFSSDELAGYLNGGSEVLQKRKQLIALMGQYSWADKRQRYHMTREEEYRGGVQAMLGIWQLMKEEKITQEDALEVRKALSLPGGLELHIGMFMPALMSQATSEQQAEWLPKAMKLRIIGTYAQTELAHGTFVRGLQTTASYDRDSQEFVVNSPSDTSTKWWPGGLGKTATHIILMARLFNNGKDLGPHSFIMQIRDLDTHLPLPGIRVGDIGPKFGYNGVDNGFIKFDHVRIPLNNMMMRFAKMSPEGKYTAPPPQNAKASYSALVYVRATIVEEAGWYLARSVTIAVRYTAVRRQTAAVAGGRELQVLDYQNTAHSLLPLLSTAYALIFMGKTAMQRYHDFEAARSNGDFSMLPDLHFMLSGLKALGTTLVSDGAEACRRCCGGHGYSMPSGLPTLFASYVQNATWEGDNNVLYLQAARSMIKGLAAVRAGKPAEGTAAYLTNAWQELSSTSRASCARDWRQPPVLIDALRHRAARLGIRALEKLQAAGHDQLQFEGSAWNDNTVDFIRAARAHSAFNLMQNFAESVSAVSKEGSVSGPASRALQLLVSLFGMFTVLSDLGDFLEDRYITGPMAAQLREEYYAVMQEVRPDAVALVDSFGFEDYVLNSALGRYDGDVYTALLEDASNSRLNKTEEGPAWHDILKPVLTAKRPQAKL